MRALRVTFLGVVMSLALGAGTAWAAPGQSFWESGAVNVFNGCTGENMVGTFSTHFVETENGPTHFNLHSEAVGEVTGARYVGNTFQNEFFHALPDGTFLFDSLLTVRIVAQGSLSDSIVIAIHIHQVIDANGNVISGWIDINPGACQGG